MSLRKMQPTIAGIIKSAGILTATVGLDAVMK